MHKPENKNLNQITVTDSAINYSFSLPRFQRKYVWKVPQEIKDLWLDIKEVFESIDPIEFKEDREKAIRKMGGDISLFMGNIIFLEIDSNKKEIIDGQQRFTTISILLIVFRQWLRDNGKSIQDANRLATTISDINKILNRVNDSGDILSARYIPATNISKLYHFICGKDWKGDFKTVEENGVPDIDPNINAIRRVKPEIDILKPIYDFFQKNITDLLDIEKDNFSILHHVITKLNFNEITLDNRRQAHQYFERTNARGTPLTVAEMLKAYLMSEIDERDIEEEWNKIVRNFGEKRILKGLKHFFRSYKGSTSSNRLFNDLKVFSNDDGNVNKKENANKILRELSRYSEFDFMIRHVFSDPAANEQTDVNGFLNYLQDLSKDSKKSFPVTCRVEKRDKIYKGIDAMNYFGIDTHIPMLWAIISKFYELNLDEDRQFHEDEILYNLFRDMERIHFLHKTVGKSQGKMEPIYTENAHKFMDCSTVEQFKSLLKSLYLKLNDFVPVREIFVENFAELQYSSKDIHYIFDRLNNHGVPRNNRKRMFDSRMALKNKKTLNGFDKEHWFPQSTAKHNEYISWFISDEENRKMQIRSYLKKESKNTFNQIENLTLNSEELESRLTAAEKISFEEFIKNNAKMALQGKIKKGDLSTPNWCHKIGNILVIDSEINNKHLNNMEPQDKYNKILELDHQNAVPYLKVFFAENSNNFADWDAERIQEYSKKLGTLAYTKYWHFQIPTQVQNMESIEGYTF